MDSAEGIEVIRHSTAHLMAQAVQSLFPGTQVTIGPVIEDGFFYDFAPPQPFTVDDLPKIEQKMRELAKADLKVERVEVPRAEAIEIFERMGEHYKVEILRGIARRSRCRFTSRATGWTSAADRTCRPRAISGRSS